MTEPLPLTHAGLDILRPALFDYPPARITLGLPLNIRHLRDPCHTTSAEACASPLCLPWRSAESRGEPDDGGIVGGFQFPSWPEQVRPRSLERRSDCSVKV